VSSKLSDHNFDLPAELIAAEPLPHRSASRMLAVDRRSRAFEDRQFTDLSAFLKKGDVLVLNNTRVFPARLYGRTETGARAEVFLVRELDGLVWEVLARPAKRLKPGRSIVFDNELSATMIDKSDDGRLVVKFECVGPFDRVLDRIGRTPLPPYIKRDRNAVDTDRERYQTIYAKHRGAIAAPTAGLHFTSEILDELKGKGVVIAEITLHVGYGTFEPVRVEDLGQHSVSPERFSITNEAAETMNAAMRDGRRIVAVGTTTTRALETSIGNNGKIVAGDQVADLTITPGYSFRAIGALLTNFHLPQSSLLVLVSAFAGHQLIMDAYRHAVAARYRFYSYGDCMLIF
jgi:S-adenosylmethionine:tRNA ribosyltransferase-isomerase